MTFITVGLRAFGIAPPEGLGVTLSLTNTGLLNALTIGLLGIAPTDTEGVGIEVLEGVGMPIRDIWITGELGMSDVTEEGVITLGVGVAAFTSPNCSRSNSDVAGETPKW